MGLKQFVEENPFVILVSVAVAVATGTAGLTGYLLEKKHDIDRAQTTSEIATLKSRLVSIERKVGTDERSFFDVSTLIVTPERVKELDGSFKTMADGAFYVAAPAMTKWKYQHTSEYEIARESIDFGDDGKMMQRLEPAIGKKNVHLWRHSDVISVNPFGKRGVEGVPKKLSFFPYVCVQIMTDEDLRTMLSAFDKIMQEAPDVDAVVKKVDEASRNADASAKAVGTSQDRRLAEAATKSAAADAAVRTEQTLAALFRRDLTAQLLNGLIAQNMQFAEMFNGAQYMLRTALRRGNVFYTDTRVEFSNVKVDGKQIPRLIVDQEYFVVTGPSAVVLVKVQIPSFDGRAEAYSWVAQWLTGLRVSLIKQ